MSTSHRIDRVESLIKEELSTIFFQKFALENLGFLTITKVKVSHDLKIAKVYISIFEKEKREQSLKKIIAKSGFIRFELASQIKIKFIPELKFFLDDSLDYVEKIDGIFKQIHENDNKGND